MSPHNNDQQGRLFLPNLFVLGAAKCATSTLHVYLGRMREVCMSKPKEPFFFEAEFEKGLDYYRRAYFSHWNGEKIIGESRHRNLYLPYVPQRIKFVNPDAKLIVLVRNPVDRAFSHWFHNFSRNSENLDFAKAIQADWNRIKSGLCYESEEEIDHHNLNLGPKKPGGEIGLGLYRTYVDSGYYYEQIKRYVSLFPRENLKVIIFEEFISRPLQVIKQLMAFLKLDDSKEEYPLPDKYNTRKRIIDNRHLTYSYRFYRMIQNFIENTRLIPLPAKRSRRSIVDNLLPKPSLMKIDAETKCWLEDHYQGHNQKLQELLNRDLSCWGW